MVLTSNHNLCNFITKSDFFSLSDWRELLNIIMKTSLYNFYPLKPHFYVVKLGFTGVYIIFLISAQKHRLWVLVRTALCEAVLTSTHNLCFEQKYEKNQDFLSESFHFLVVKFLIYLNRHVFVMLLTSFSYRSDAPVFAMHPHSLIWL